MSFSWIEAFVLGVSTGPLCIASCAPVIVPFFASAGKSKIKTDLSKMGLFLAGRLSGYLIIGLIAGIVGTMSVSFFAGRTESIASIIMGILLLVFGILRNFPSLKFCKIIQADRTANGFAFILGTATGISICPPFIAAFAAGAALGNVALSILYFLFFFFGTSLIIFPLFLSGFIGRMEEFKTGARICLLIVGAWFIIKGIFGLVLL